MLTWLVVKSWAISTWRSTISWCKERWELLVGVLVGVLGMVALRGRSKDVEEIIEEKNQLRDKELEAIRSARDAEDNALKKNLKKFFATNEQARKEYEEKLAELDEEKRNRVIELLDSDNPEADIAAKLKEFLK